MRAAFGLILLFLPDCERPVPPAATPRPAAPAPNSPALAADAPPRREVEDPVPARVPPAPPPPGATARPAPRAPGLGSECQTDADCTVAPVGCCGCTAGGAQRAVPAGAVRDDGACADTMCPAVMSRDPSCRKVARCQQGRCALADPGGPPSKIPDSAR